MKKNKLKKYKLCYVNRLLNDVIVYFYSIDDALDFSFNFNDSILYIKYFYDLEHKSFIYNFLSSNKTF